MHFIDDQSATTRHAEAFSNRPTADRAWVTTPVAARMLKQCSGDPYADIPAAARYPVCLRGQGRGRYVPTPVEGCMLMICMRGSLEIESVDGVFDLRGRHFICLPTYSVAKLVAGQRSDWMAVRLPDSFLKKLAGSHAFRTAPDPMLLPVSMPLTRQMMRCTAELLKALPAFGEAEAGEQVGEILFAAIQAQSTTRHWVQRAYGRSERHRRRVVVRLLSARNRIMNAPSMTHDLDALAAAAMYSPSHFLRSFRDVFGKTPHGLLAESRMAKARELIRGSDLSICEVAASVGYESRHAFSRRFKRETGTTASDFREASDIAVGD